MGSPIQAPLAIDVRVDARRISEPVVRNRGGAIRNRSVDCRWNAHSSGQLRSTTVFASQLDSERLGGSLAPRPWSRDCNARSVSSRSGPVFKVGAYDGQLARSNPQSLQFVRICVAKTYNECDAARYRQSGIEFRTDARSAF
jgi:hypothetical protein